MTARHALHVCMLLLAPQMNNQVSSLSLYDIAGTPGVAADVGHVNTRALVKASGGTAQAGGGAGSVVRLLFGTAL